MTLKMNANSKRIKINDIIFQKKSILSSCQMKQASRLIKGKNNVVDTSTSVCPYYFHSLRGWLGTNRMSFLKFSLFPIPKGTIQLDNDVQKGPPLGQSCGSSYL